MSRQGPSGGAANQQGEQTGALRGRARDNPARIVTPPILGKWRAEEVAIGTAAAAAVFE